MKIDETVLEMVYDKKLNIFGVHGYGHTVWLGSENIIPFWAETRNVARRTQVFKNRVTDRIKILQLILDAEEEYKTLGYCRWKDES